jgi:hypothetical protein
VIIRQIEKGETRSYVCSSFNFVPSNVILLQTISLINKGVEYCGDCLCGQVGRVSGYSRKGPGFDS